MWPLHAFTLLVDDPHDFYPKDLLYLDPNQSS